MSIRDQLKQAIYGQESGHGKADTSQENYAGARGPMQVTKSTFEGMKAQGLIPSDYDHANPEHTKSAGFALIDNLADKYGDDPAKVAAAYYGGEKAVLPDGRIANFGDKKNPQAPRVRDYVSQVLGRMGLESGAQYVDENNPAPRSSVLASWDTPMPGRMTSVPRTSGTQKETSIAQGLELGVDQVPEVVSLKASQLQAQAQQKEIDDSSFLDKARDAYIQQGFTAAAIRAALRPQFPVDPSFQLKPEDLAGLTENEQDFVKQAHSQAHLDRIKWEINDNREAQRNINLSGTGVGIAASLFAGLPEGFLTGMGAARAFTLAKAGSLALAAQGRTAAAVGSSIAENVGANLAMTAAQSSFDPYVSGHDYAMAVGMGMLGVGMGLPGIFGAERQALKVAGQAMQEGSAARQVEVREQAVRNLGADAEPERLQAEAQRLEGNAVRESLATGEVEPGRKLSADPIEGEKAMELRAAEAERGVVAPELETRSDIEASEPTGALFEKYGPGVHTDSELPVSLKPAQKVLDDLAKQFNPEASYVLRQETGAGISGRLQRVQGGTREFVVRLADKEDKPTDVVLTAVHEFGHSLEHSFLGNASPEIRAGVERAYGRFVEALRSGDIEQALGMRRRAGQVGVSDTAFPKQWSDDYLKSKSEFIAEQFAKYVQDDAVNYGGKVSIPTWVKDNIAAMVDKLIGLFVAAKKKAYIAPETELADFFDAIRQGSILREQTPAGKGMAENFSKETAQSRDQHISDMLNDPIAQKNGLGLLPVDTPQQQAELAAMIDLYKKATETGYKVDEGRLSTLMNTAVFQGGQSIANVMARSENPVARMVSAELMENPSGSLGRRSTAALSKYLNERQYLGNTLNEVQDLYTSWRTAQGESVVGDFFNGKTWEQWNRLVAEEIEGRRANAVRAESPTPVSQAADVIEKGYERMRLAQQDAKTIGWGALPETSRGYMPHRMDPAKLVGMTNEQRGVLHAALADQFISISKFDPSFADNLASKYIQRVHDRAMGGFSAPVGAHQLGAADVVEDALEAMGMSRPQILAAMKKYQRGAATHTKQRLNLNLTQVHTLADGSQFRLLDVMDTDQFNLLRNQARRVSGEVALAKHGVMGKPGLNVLRTAMTYGADGQRATAKELEAFDQMASEFMGDAFGTQNRNLDRLMQASTLARLGGMGFTQMAEAINGVAHLGVAKTFSAIASLPRLRSEIKALARGEKVENPIIGSLESYRGVEFGTEAYKLVFPFDSTAATPTYGKETLNVADRLLRAGGHVQGKLSLWRTIHSTQQRGMAEQIVRKASEYISLGKEDAALRDMGISPELAQTVRDSGAIRMENGKLVEFDITKMSDPRAAEEFVQAVHRGVSQIIQGTFLGEQGKWAHDGLMRMLTQFRTFSLTSVEKQWGRQVGNVGTYRTFGMLMGAMSMAAPIYMARTYLQSIGREDRDGYLEEQLSLEAIAKATLNYIALTGLAGNFLDISSAVTGIGTPTGGRSGQGASFLGNVVAPSAGLLEDIYKGLQNTKDGTDPKALLRSMPFSRIPYLIPAIQALGD